MADDFTMKPMVDPVGVARLAQDQQLKKAELERQQKMDNFNMLTETAKQVGNLVSASVEASKARQRKDMINTLSSSLANKVPNIMAPQQGPVMEGQPALPPVMTPDVNKQNAVRSAVQISPDAFAKQLAEQVLPAPKNGGTPARSFESLLTSKVNNGEITLAEAAEQLSRFKPSNTVIGYDENGNPIYSNSKAIPTTTSPLNTVPAPAGGINPKPERASEAELGKQSDLQNVDTVLKEVEKNFNDAFVGPVAGRVNSTLQMFDATATNERANFVSSLNNYRNGMIKAITGAQLSEPEAARIMKQLPDEKMSPTDFKAKLKFSRKLLGKAIETRKGKLKDAGYTGINESSEESTAGNDPLGIR